MQTVIVISLVVIAATYLGWQAYKRFFAKETKCDGCAMSKAASEQD